MISKIRLGVFQALCWACSCFDICTYMLPIGCCSIMGVGKPASDSGDFRKPKNKWEVGNNCAPEKQLLLQQWSAAGAPDLLYV